MSCQLIILITDNCSQRLLHLHSLPIDRFLPMSKGNLWSIRCIVLLIVLFSLAYIKINKCKHYQTVQTVMILFLYLQSALQRPLIYNQLDEHILFRVVQKNNCPKHYTFGVHWWWKLRIGIERCLPSYSSLFWVMPCLNREFSPWCWTDARCFGW